MVNRRIKTFNQRMKETAPYGKPLTPRERQILRLVALGMTNKEIGRELFISECTVKSHLQRVGNKTQIGDRTQLGVWAFAQEIRNIMFVAETLPGLRDSIYQTFENWLSVDLYKSVLELPTGVEENDSEA